MSRAIQFIVTRVENSEFKKLLFLQQMLKKVQQARAQETLEVKHMHVKPTENRPSVRFTSDNIEMKNSKIKQIPRDIENQKHDNALQEGWKKRSWLRNKVKTLNYLGQSFETQQKTREAFHCGLLEK